MIPCFCYETLITNVEDQHVVSMHAILVMNAVQRLDIRWLLAAVMLRRIGEYRNSSLYVPTQVLKPPLYAYHDTNDDDRT